MKVKAPDQGRRAWLRNNDEKSLCIACAYSRSSNEAAFGLAVLKAARIEVGSFHALHTNDDDGGAAAERRRATLW